MSLVSSAEVTSSTFLRSIAPPLYNRINGTSGADDITGTNEFADFITGKNGNDILRGGNGNDFVHGGNGDDVMSGDHVPSQTTESNDIVVGGNGNDQLFGGIVEGDQSFNRGPDERDILVGGSGNDYLSGGEGDDLLIGSSSRERGAGEVDIMEGGQGRDLFVLGDRNNAFYTQGGINQDFAIITDFEVGGDRVRLHGEASQYVLGYDSSENATALGYLGGGSYEFVGVFVGQDLSALSLDSRSFAYANV